MEMELTPKARQRQEIGRRIRRERLLWDMTQEEMSSLLGISTNYLGQLERGNRELSRNMEERICRLFHMSRAELRMERQLDLWPARVSESGIIFNDLSEEEVTRLLHSCSPSELQLCGHLIRSLLRYLRNPASPCTIAPRGLRIDADDTPPFYLGESTGLLPVSGNTGDKT